jgi:DNA primase catalytic subunit
MGLRRMRIYAPIKFFRCHTSPFLASVFLAEDIKAHSRGVDRRITTDIKRLLRLPSITLPLFRDINVSLPNEAAAISFLAWRKRRRRTTAFTRIIIQIIREILSR